jgi:hypothetical protein
MSLLDYVEAPEQEPASTPRFYSALPPVFDSADFRRIKALPLRSPASPEEQVRLAEEMTSRLLRNPQPACNCASKWKQCANRLRPIQGWALHEAMITGRGPVGLIGVGGGKGPTTMMLPMVIPGVKVAVLLIPANMRDAFEREWEKFSVHFRLPRRPSDRWYAVGDDKPLLHVITYSELSSPKSSDLLKKLRPDLIIADEAHNLRNRGAARVRRFLRYMHEARSKYAPLSGTMENRSPMEAGHQYELALGEGSPYPLHYPTLEHWSEAVSSRGVPCDPGVLMEFCELGENVREGLRRRVTHSPGVVSTSESQFGGSLIIRRAEGIKVPELIQKMLEEVRSTTTRPDGEELVDEMASVMCRRQLGAGGYSYWAFPHGEPPELIDEWFERRKEWCRELRDVLKLNREHMDSPLLCENAAIRHQRKGRGETIDPTLPSWPSVTYPGWAEIRDRVYHETRWKWVSDFLVDYAAEWMADNKGIVWVETPELGHRIARKTKLPYYGQGKAASKLILDEKGDRSIVASSISHSTGKQLTMWSRMLVLQSPSSGTTWEQLIGREHRPGQEADEVVVDVALHTDEYESAFAQARLDAEYQYQTKGAEQKLLLATYTGEFP